MKCIAAATLRLVIILITSFNPSNMVVLYVELHLMQELFLKGIAVTPLDIIVTLKQEAYILVDCLDDKDKMQQHTMQEDSYMDKGKKDDKS
jgi:hypothetical protein